MDKQKLGWIDVSKYDLSNHVRDEGTVYPYRFSRVFLGYWDEKHELEKSCPKCGKSQTVHLGSYLSSDLFHNVFACMNCLIAWDVWDQTGRYEPRYADRVKSLVRTLYDPDFTPDNEDIPKLTKFLEGQDEALPAEDIAHGLQWTVEKTLRILDIADEEGIMYQPDLGYWELVCLREIKEVLY